MKLRITIDGKIYQAEVELEEEEEVPAYVPPAPAFRSPVDFSSTQYAKNANGPGGEKDKVCRSPVTGLVIRVNVEAGQAVEADELLVVLEAMKMETRVTAHQAGKIKSVHVVAGNSVKVHQPLVEFE